MLINAPLMLGGAALAEPLVRVVFGLRWLPAAPILSVLCLAGVLYPLHALNLHVLLAQGHSKRMFHIEVAKEDNGDRTDCGRQLLWPDRNCLEPGRFSILSLALNTHYSGKFLGYGLVAQSRDVLPTVALALVMAAVVAALDHYWPWETHAAIRFGVLICTGAVFFIAGAAALRLEAFRDVALILQSRSSSRHGEMGTL
ncbi:MAG: hypothetical protein IPH99_11850 [Xanthomonadales bacterium]|nr:hypothetical protein [Xanthomonadales bacterium]